MCKDEDLRVQIVRELYRQNRVVVEWSSMENSPSNSEDPERVVASSCDSVRV